MPVPSSKNSKSSCLFHSTSLTALTMVLSICSIGCFPLFPKFEDPGPGARTQKEPDARRRCQAHTKTKKDGRAFRARPLYSVLLPERFGVAALHLRSSQ